MLEQAPKSSRLFEQLAKLHVDFRKKSIMGRGMADDDEIDPIKVQTSLFALVTARFEDTHEIAMKGQAANFVGLNASGFVIELRSQLDEINVQLDALYLMHDR